MNFLVGLRIPVSGSVPVGLRIPVSGHVNLVKERALRNCRLTS